MPAGDAVTCSEGRRPDEAGSWREPLHTVTVDLSGDLITDTDSAMRMAMARQYADGRARQAAAGVAFLTPRTSGSRSSGMRGNVLSMTNSNEAVLREPPVAGSETDTLLGSLERERATFAWKCGGLDSAGLTATVGASSMTLGGLLKHLALIEDEYFGHKLRGQELGPPWDAADWDADPDWEWHSAAGDSPEQLMTLWQDAVARSRVSVAEALAAGGPDQLTNFTWPDGRSPSLRRILIDLIEEYARHVGHADLIRESVDGLTGEDPPR